MPGTPSRFPLPAAPISPAWLRAGHTPPACLGSCLPCLRFCGAARQRCSAIAKGPMFLRRKTSLPHPVKDGLKASPQQKIPRRGGVTCPLCSLAYIRPEDTQAGHGASLQLQPPAFLLAGGNCSARNFHAALRWQSCHQSRRARGWWPSGSTTSSPRPTCCSEQGHGPGPLCWGAGVLPPRLSSAPGNRSRKGMLGQERAAWLGPDDTGMDACPRLASPCPSSCLL